MKNRIITSILAFAIIACAGTTPAQNAATATALASIVETVAVASGKVTPAQGSAALAGIAALSQAYVGIATPATANVAAGAGNATVGNAVQAALPPGTLTQSQVNAIYNAAALVAKAPAPATGASTRRTLYYGNAVIHPQFQKGAKVATREAL